MSGLRGSDILAWAKGEDLQGSFAELDETEQQVAIAGLRAKRGLQVRDALATAIQARQQGIASEMARLGDESKKLNTLSKGSARISLVERTRLELRRSRVTFDTFRLPIPEPEQGVSSQDFWGRIRMVRRAIAPALEPYYSATAITRAARLVLARAFTPEFIEVESAEETRRGVLPLATGIIFRPDENGALDAQTLLERTTRYHGLGPGTAMAMIDVIDAYAPREAAQATSRD